MAPLTARTRKALGFNPAGWERARKAVDFRVAEFLPSIGAQGEGPRALAVITPWEGTSIPWFTIFVGLMMASRARKSGSSSMIFAMAAIRSGTA
jgi:hypothetical protein